MLTGPFLTDLDRRAEVKGSVDPLGMTPLWTRFGRRIVNNLTTVSSSVRDFKTLILGFALIQDLHARATAEEEVDDLGAFLRWEQLAAYVRLHHGKDKEFRGTTRVQRRLSEGVIVPISKDRDCQILASQKTYGLWGLFTVPARSSGLLEDDNTLTSASQEFVAQTWRRDLNPVWDDLLKLISKDNRRVNLDQWANPLKRLNRVWTQTGAVEKAFWDKHLIQGGPEDPTHGRQVLLARLLREVDEEVEVSPAMLSSLVIKASRKNQELADLLTDVIAVESVLAPAGVLFGFLQQRHGKTVEQTVAAIRRVWPAQVKNVQVDHFAALQPVVTQVIGDSTEANMWVSAANAIRAGRYHDVIELLLALNASVMKRRGGTPWVVDDGGALKVRYRDEPEDLPQKSELPALWRNPYFIGSLRSVTHQIEAA